MSDPHEIRAAQIHDGSGLTKPWAEMPQDYRDRMVALSKQELQEFEAVVSRLMYGDPTKGPLGGGGLLP